MVHFQKPRYRPPLCRDFSRTQGTPRLLESLALINICDFKVDSFEKLQESVLVLRCPGSAQNLDYKS